MCITFWVLIAKKETQGAQEHCCIKCVYIYDKSVKPSQALGPTCFGPWYCLDRGGQTCRSSGQCWAEPPIQGRWLPHPSPGWVSVCTNMPLITNDSHKITLTWLHIYGSINYSELLPLSCILPMIFRKWWTCCVLLVCWLSQRIWCGSLVWPLLEWLEWIQPPVECFQKVQSPPL